MNIDWRGHAGAPDLSKKGFLMKLKLISLVSGLFLAGAVWAQTVPNDFVEKLSNEVLTEVRNDAQMKQGDIGRISQLVDQKLMPAEPDRKSVV